MLRVDAIYEESRERSEETHDDTIQNPARPQTSQWQQRECEKSLLRYLYENLQPVITDNVNPAGGPQSWRWQLLRGTVVSNYKKEITGS